MVQIMSIWASRYTIIAYPSFIIIPSKAYFFYIYCLESMIIGSKCLLINIVILKLPYSLNEARSLESLSILLMLQEFLGYFCFNARSGVLLFTIIHQNRITL